MNKKHLQTLLMIAPALFAGVIVLYYAHHLRAQDASIAAFAVEQESPVIKEFAQDAYPEALDVQEESPQIQTEEPVVVPVADKQKQVESVSVPIQDIEYNSLQTIENVKPATVNPLQKISKNFDSAGILQDKIPVKELVLGAIPEVPKKSVDFEKILEDAEAHSIEFQFENADLMSLVKLIGEQFHYTFITDDVLDPIGPGPNAQYLKGSKFSFQTHAPLTKKQAWSLFLTFLDMAGFNIVPQPNPGTYRIVKIDAAKTSPLPSYIGIDPDQLPDNDGMIRYIYFIENAATKDLFQFVDALKSSSGKAFSLEEHKALLIIDKSYNIKSLMRVIKALDRVTMPETMSVLKLRRADAAEVKALYDKLIGADKNEAPKFFAKKQPTALYFPEAIDMFVEPRTNALILFGGKNEVRKVEDFILKHVDIELDKPYSPLRVYQLKYAKAQNVVDILTSVTTFASGKPAAAVGGVRGPDKYIKAMKFTAETETNQIIIQGDDDDYQQVLAIIKDLDEPQPQVYIEVLILSVIVDEDKALGTQLRSKSPGGASGLLGDNVKFQTSGFVPTGTSPLNSIVERPNPELGTIPGVERLLGNLINLATGVPNGSTVLTLGSDLFGVWGIFKALDTITDTEIVSNPCLVATNKTPSKVRVGEIRRVVTSNIFTGSNGPSASSVGDTEAALTVEVVPQINSDGMIILSLDIDLTNFVSPDLTSATKTIRKITTQATVANKEVLALGGIVRDNIAGFSSKVPILGDIPILGWLFKNKSKRTERESLLILISTEIIEPQSAAVDKITIQRVQEYQNTLSSAVQPAEHRDPIHRKFFEPGQNNPERQLDNFIFQRNPKMDKILHSEYVPENAYAHKPVYTRKKTTTKSKAESDARILLGNTQEVRL